MTIKQVIEEVEARTIWILGRVFQAEKAAKAKALSWDGAYVHLSSKEACMAGASEQGESEEVRRVGKDR